MLDPQLPMILTITMSFATAKFTLTYLSLLTLLELGCARRTAHDTVTVSGDSSSSFRPPSVARAYTCLVPEQPVNGEWKLHRDFCNDKSADCKLRQGIDLNNGIQLVYSCNHGYKLRGNADVYCRYGGKWSSIPVCDAESQKVPAKAETKCPSLNSAYAHVSCSHDGRWMSCDSPVPPRTRADVSCRPGYRRASSPLHQTRVQCNESGQWKPEPIKCVPVCGRAITHQRPLVANGQNAKLGDFPWHATIYVEKRTSNGLKKEFQCGATIIHANLLLTAAHCVFNEITKTTVDPKTVFVLTGNVFRDYDSPLHDPLSVARGAVKHVHLPCQYHGFVGNYASDIALIELQEPFQLSGILLPACLDFDGYSEQILEPGAYGRIAGFGRTAIADSSSILQTLTVPYVSYSQCRSSVHDEQNDSFITIDKFCAGYTNGSAVCEGDTGGGLVLKRNDDWYVMGVLSLGLGVNLENGERTCDKYSYSLYTKVSIYMSWIQDVTLSVDQNVPVPPCRSRE